MEHAVPMDIKNQTQNAVQMDTTNKKKKETKNLKRFPDNGNPTNETQIVSAYSFVILAIQNARAGCSIE